MNRGIRTSLLATILVAAGTSLQARTSECLNVPDSVTLLAYAQNNGESGLRLAWSRDSARWFSVAEGGQRKMALHLAGYGQRTGDGTCLFGRSADVGSAKLF